MTESKIINNVSKKGISILRTNVTKKIAKICPKIAIHRIFIRLPSKIVFIKIKYQDLLLLENFLL